MDINSITMDIRVINIWQRGYPSTHGCPYEHCFDTSIWDLAVRTLIMPSASFLLKDSRSIVGYFRPFISIRFSSVFPTYCKTIGKAVTSIFIDGTRPNIR